MNDNTYYKHISAKHNLLDLKLKEVWKYRDLILLFARKTLVVSYKQTILGPLWLFITPFVTSLMYMLVFGRIAKLSTEGIPQILFYLFSNAAWTFFSTCVTNTSDTFASNVAIFGKVYFPRLVIPLSNVLTSLVQFTVQFVLGTAIMFYYVMQSEIDLQPLRWVLIPIVLLHLSIVSLGFGIIASSLTTKYRDLRMLIQFIIRLWMYASPVVYPLSQFTQGVLRRILLLNPVTVPMEMLRYALWGTPTIPAGWILYSWIISFLLFFFGIMLFNYVERTFADTV